MKTNIPDITWWHQLSPQWKQAFAETCFYHTNEPAPGELAQVFAAPALRFAGPSAPYPNMSFELEDLTGLTALTQLEVLVVIFHRIENIEPLNNLTSLKSLFLYNNSITSLSGIESLTNLEQLYVQWNAIDSLKPLTSLTRLKEIYIHDNKIASFDGITADHAETLEQFFCKPNENLKKKDLVILESTLGIRCRSL